jgi:hypothetical protein
MAVSQDLLSQNLSTVQSEQQPFPPTIASTTTIAPTSFITFVSGTTAVATITPPIAGQHMLCLIFTNASPAALATTGNLTNTLTPTQNVPVLAFYNPNGATPTYYVK